jgi:hypothetical protein
MGIYKKYIYYLFILVFFLSLNADRLALNAAEKPLRLELIWYKNKKCYKDLDEVKEDLKKGILIHPPDFFQRLNIINEGVGEIDSKNKEYYWASKPSTLGMMLEVAREYKISQKDPKAKLCISALLRTIEYQNILSQYNNWADLGRSTHTNGASFDITVHPMFMKDTDKIEALRAILKELHHKGEIFFIDEAGNSCFHVCLNPDREKKYEDRFNRIMKEYEFSSYYNNTRFLPVKNPGELKELVDKGYLLQLNKFQEHYLPVKVNIPENKKSSCSVLRPETIGLLIEISKNLRTMIGKKFLLPITELMRTMAEEREKVRENPILPEGSFFAYGTAFQINGSILAEEELNVLKDYLQKLNDSGDIDFIEEDGKYDVIIKPGVTVKYMGIYNDTLIASQRFAMIFNHKYLYPGGLIFFFIITGLFYYKYHYNLKELIKIAGKKKRKKKQRKIREYDNELC